MITYTLWREAWEETLELDWRYEENYRWGLEEYISEAYRDYVETQRYEGEKAYG